MKTPRPRWNRGTLFSSRPPLFTSARNKLSRKYLLPQSLSNAWGVEALQLDEEAMQHQSLTLKQLRLCLPDGSRIDTAGVSALCCAIPLEQHLAQRQQQVDVLLAVPANEHPRNLLPHRCRAQEPTALAYPVRTSGRESSESGVPASRAIRVRFSVDENRGYQTYPIARLNRNAQGRWEIDPSFIPPLLTFSASPMLVALSKKLLLRSRMKRRLLALRHEPPEQNGQPDIPRFWLLNVLNRYESVLSEVSLATALHPELVYRELVKLAGPLLPYTQAWSSADIPRYDHSRLGDVFPSLFSLLSALLETCLPARAVGIALMREKDHLWVGQLPPHNLDSVSGIYLLARSSWPSHRLRTHIMTQCEVGTRHAVHARKAAVDQGKALQPVSHIPAAIPLNWENLCFVVDLEHSGVQDALASGHCAISVPDHGGDLTLKLFAVMKE
ncbi:type VI secretion system baseplate subunit TssK [Candidatus Symbiopectobacterium sp. NZEC151]|uniref:type VI secretion system baseplate subunit TssK n=2 Tax=unclassified Symbiopectobacterium TaxID=2794573 RepID=UPI002226F35F|nr:type VI secretion system baseplate subunit TssK [Candidatus Symbiopectobacterium sp. NZEC151]MCW2475912.1 type VI secretion system baseplate subunit TssK [Candidatus Symbiopectobacterium sp. NZEC151]